MALVVRDGICLQIQGVHSSPRWLMVERLKLALFNILSIHRQDYILSFLSFASVEYLYAPEA